jgi:hypothetical protein
MSREAIEVGAFTWSRVQRLYDADPTGTLAALCRRRPGMSTGSVHTAVP